MTDRPHPHPPDPDELDPTLPRRRSTPVRPGSTSRDAEPPTVPANRMRPAPAAPRTRTPQPATSEMPLTPDTMPAAAGTRTARTVRGAAGDRDTPFGKYRLGAELGRGGMGQVRIASDARLGRDVALKLMLRPDDRTEVSQFVEEAQITAQLEHPNIVPVHELGEDDAGRPWMAMKRIEGESLADRIADWQRRDRGALRQEHLHTILGLFNKLCDAAAFAHSRGVIHRDIKPQNVMVGAFGEVLLVDWGLARPLDRANTDVRPVRVERRADGSQLTMDGEVFGTPAFMPPEQADGRVHEVDERADIFALGGVLYQMLTLAPPYEGRNTSDTLARAARHRLIPPRKRAPGARIPAELQAIVLKAMAEQPDDRYQSVRDLQGDLAAWQAHLKTTAFRAGPITRLVKWSRRHPTATSVAGLAVVAGLIVAVLVSQLQAARKDAEAAEAREELAAALAREAQAERDAAEALRDEYSVLADERLSDETEAAIAEFKQLWGQNRVIDFDGYEIGAIIAEPDRLRFLAAYNDLMRFHKLRGTTPDARSYIHRAILHHIGGEFEPAVRDYDLGLELDPNDFRGHVNRAQVRITLRNLEGALEDAEAAVRIDPQNSHSFNTRGIVKRNLGRIGDAQADFRRALDVEPGNLPAQYNHALMHHLGGDYAAAIRELNAVIERAPDYVQAIATRGDARAQIGDLRGALGDLEVACRMDPDRPDLLLGRANVKRMVGDLPGARKDLDRLLELRPAYQRGLSLRGIVLRLLGDLPAALRDLDTALSLNPRDLAALTQRGRARKDTGDLTGAIEDYTAALALDGRDANTYIRRGIAYQLTNQDDEALADYQAALRINPRLWRAEGSMGGLLLKLGRNSEALAAFQRAYRLCDDPGYRNKLAGGIRQLGGQVPD